MYMQMCLCVVCVCVCLVAPIQAPVYLCADTYIYKYIYKKL